MTLLKSIVVCLVLANVGYFLWARGIAGAPLVPVPAGPAATLKLASESPEAARPGGIDAGSTTGAGGVEVDLPDSVLTPLHILGFIAVTAATINVVGGFLITDRMLKMFKHEQKKPEGAAK